MITVLVDSMHAFENHIVVMGNGDGGYSRIVVEMIMFLVSREEN